MRVTETEQGMLNLVIDCKEVLYEAYMPFVKQGCLFIPTNKEYKLGTEVLALLKLMDDTDKYPIKGRVIWHTPSGAQGGRKAGIGLQFMHDEAHKLRDRIETYLGGALNSDRSTDTM